MMDVHFAITLGEWIILSFAAYRFTQFFIYDSIWGGHPDSGSNRSVRVDKFAYTLEGVDRSFVRGKIGDLLTCPWCLGFWLSAFTYVAFVVSMGLWVGTPLVVHFLTVFAVAGGQGLLNSLRE